MITLENWRERMRADMGLRDYRPRTRSGYELATRLFLDWAKTEPAALTEEQVRAYFLFLREQKKQAPSSINVAVCALRFFCTHTLRRDWPVFELLRVNEPRSLPTVLSTKEVRALLASVRHPVRRVALGTIYALGLRLGEGLRLETAHIDSDRLMVWVRDGKGAKDRGVPLPRPLLARLRHYWKHERPASPTRYFFVPTSGEAPLHETTLQKTFTAAHAELGLAKHASIHSALLHAFAPPHATAPVCPLDDFLFRAAFHNSRSLPHSRTEPPISGRSPSSCALAVFPHAVLCMTGTLENAALLVR